jgi:hypothetical protein
MPLLAGAGKYYAVNVPLKEGMDDASYEALFKPIMRKVMETFRPGAVVLQSGEWVQVCSVAALVLWLTAAVLQSSHSRPGCCVQAACCPVLPPSRHYLQRLAPCPPPSLQARTR